jgi:hypothetical protein
VGRAKEKYRERERERERERKIGNEGTGEKIQREYERET